ncbi:MAG: response regulator, partial [Bacteroidota bacterium]|nr:response regulator [Bacteroidota bacterium]
MPDILWVDDEIHMLKGHLLFLEGKGYTFQTCNNGGDAIELLDNKAFDAVFLDENMPGLSGLEVLEQMKLKRPETPIVMITKSEEEQIMEMAIGSKIADYLIKPVNPNQVLLCLKKLLKGKELVSKKTTRGYQQVFGKLTMEMQQLETWQEWSDFYRELLKWELELEKSSEEGLKSVLATQKSEANELFSRFISNNYERWFESKERPMLSHEVVSKIVGPKIKA